MKCKIHYNPFSTEEKAVPIPKMETVQHKCLHCGRTTSIPVPTQFFDFEKESEASRSELQRVINRFDQIVSDLTAMYPGENPVLNYLENEWAVLLGSVRKHFEEGEEWKQ